MWKWREHTNEWEGVDSKAYTKRNAVVWPVVRVSSRGENELCCVIDTKGDEWDENAEETDNMPDQSVNN